MTTSGIEVNMDNTDKVVDLLIELKREVCKKYYSSDGCYQIDCYDKLHWCPMAYDGMNSHKVTYHDYCQINDIINLITESDGQLND